MKRLLTFLLLAIAGSAYAMAEARHQKEYGESLTLTLASIVTNAAALIYTELRDEMSRPQWPALDAAAR
jgi:hypothetical protein